MPLDKFLTYGAEEAWVFLDWTRSDIVVFCNNMKTFLSTCLFSSLLFSLGMSAVDMDGDDPPPLGDEEIMKKFESDGVLVSSGMTGGVLWRFLSEEGRQINVIVFRRSGGEVGAGGWISEVRTGDSLSTLPRAVGLVGLQPVEDQTLSAWAEGEGDDSGAVDSLKQVLSAAHGVTPNFSLIGVTRVVVNIQTFTVYDVGQSMTNLDKIVIDNSDTVVMRWGMLW